MAVRTRVRARVMMKSAFAHTSCLPRDHAVSAKPAPIGRGLG
jgi:hypothetical protein